jgi:trans-2,3-dihydro-3-hydroxyanthranilate isomerase
MSSALPKDDAPTRRSEHLANAVPFALVDVFGVGPLTGNPVAVVDLTHHGSGDPPMVWMRAVAREFNQAETTFVLPPASTQAHRRLRSLTAGGVEVFGAGHNALGAWWWLLRTGQVQPSPEGVLVQQIGSRLLQVLVGDQQLRMVQDHAQLGNPVPARDVAAVVGLESADLDATVPPRVVGTGADHLIAAVTSTRALSDAEPAKDALAQLTTTVGAQGLYLTVIGRHRPVTSASTRFFNPGAGLDEDPATGSAAGPLAAYLRSLRLLDDNGALTVHQGESMHRPSTVHVTAPPDDSPPTVGGSAALSAHGFLAGPGDG